MAAGEWGVGPGWSEGRAADDGPVGRSDPWSEMQGGSAGTPHAADRDTFGTLLSALISKLIELTQCSWIKRTNSWPWLGITNSIAGHTPALER